MTRWCKRLFRAAAETRIRRPAATMLGLTLILFSASDASAQGIAGPSGSETDHGGVDATLLVGNRGIFLQIRFAGRQRAVRGVERDEQKKRFVAVSLDKGRRLAAEGIRQVAAAVLFRLRAPHHGRLTAIDVQVPLGAVVEAVEFVEPSGRRLKLIGMAVMPLASTWMPVTR